MAKSPEAAKATMIANMKDKTGASLDDWLRIVSASGAAKHKEIVAMLKSDHGLTHGYANMVALQYLGSDSHSASDADALVTAQYAGAKAPLKALYDKLVATVKSFGPDVEISPKKAYVSLRRSKQFAILQPSTATRLDIGLVLKGLAPRGRLESSGSFNAMVTHRVKVSNAAELDPELFAWLKRAYDEA